jgi:hypothetical protein
MLPPMNLPDREIGNDCHRYDRRNPGQFCIRPCCWTENVYLPSSFTPRYSLGPMRNNSLSQFLKLRRQLTEERGTLESRLRQLNEALGEMPLPSLSLVQGATDQEETELTRPGRRGKRRMSPEGRARIAAAQRARWAKKNRGQAILTKSASDGIAQKPRRMMSAAGRKAIAEAARKRWAAAKAAGKSRL